MVRELLLLCFTVLPFHTFGFRNPLDKSLSLPYGRQMRAVLPGNIAETPYEETDDLMWWHSLSRNNTLDCECGQFSTSKQVEHWQNEGVSSINRYSWSVSLVAPDGVYAFCGGTLVNDRYVLTSASCVDGSNSDGVEVLIGTWPNAHFNQMSFDDVDQLNVTKLIRKKVHRVIIHPQYLDGHLDYNIALLRLKGPVPTFGEKNGVSPVCLPSAEVSFDGWNATSLLWRFDEADSFIIPIKRSEVSSRVLSKTDCKAFAYSKEWENMPDTMICSEMDKPEESHPYFETYDCPGDAGSPLLVIRENKKIQIGIDSWTACYGRPRGVGVYTRINEFLPWIKLHISLDGRVCTK